MLCSHCRERYYPQNRPRIIVAIRREDSVLLARHVLATATACIRYSAGFALVVGETL